MAEPQREHRWLDRLVGEWTSEIECSMGPDQPPMKSRGVDVVRSLGGLWIVAEGEGEMPGGGTAKTIMTLGYDPRARSLRGDVRRLDDDASLALQRLPGRVREGAHAGQPRAPTSPARRRRSTRTCIEFVDDDHRIMTSRVLGDDGDWHHFMTAHYRRKK